MLASSETAVSRDLVRQRVFDGVCLGENIDGTQCERPAVKRGLCAKCHMTWYRTCRTKSEKDAIAYTRRLVRLGRILAVGQLKFYRNRSVLRRMA